LAVLLGRQLDRIATLTAQANALPARQPEAVRARLKQQIALLVENADSFDSNRLHQEAVLLAVKADIREELDRLGAHVTSARSILAQGGRSVVGWIFCAGILSGIQYPLRQIQ